MEYRPLSALRAWEKNPRKNDEAAVFLADKIKRFGFTDPIIVTSDNRIRAGHTRYKAAKLAGMATVPVIVMDFKSEADAIAYSIAHNKASEQALWDEGMLTDLFGQLEKLDVDVSAATGFTQMEIEGLGAAQTSYAAGSFRDIAEQFEKKSPAAAKKEFWVWMMLPDEASFQALLAKFRRASVSGRVGKSARELDAAKLLPAVGIRSRPAATRKVR